MRPAVAFILLMSSLVAPSGCATVSHLPSPAAATPIHESRITVTLHGRPLTLHLATPASAGTPPPAAGADPRRHAPGLRDVRRPGPDLGRDFGLTFVKLREEALVDLPSFTLDGAAGARPRQTLRRLKRDGGTFRMLAPVDVPAHLDALRRVSDDWLAAKAVAERASRSASSTWPTSAASPSASSSAVASSRPSPRSGRAPVARSSRST